jgi:hypothetical protein
MTHGNGNPCDRSPLESRTANQRGCDDETSDLAWRGGYLDPARSCRPGVGAARHYQSRLVRPVLSERKLPKLRAQKPLLELWLAASRTSLRRGLSPSPPSLALMPASEPVQTLPRLRTAGTSRQRGFNYAIGRCFHRSRAQ